MRSRPIRRVFVVNFIRIFPVAVDDEVLRNIGRSRDVLVFYSSFVTSARDSFAEPSRGREVRANAKQCNEIARAIPFQRAESHSPSRTAVDEYLYQQLPG